MAQFVDVTFSMHPGQLHRDEIDIAPAEFTVTELRSRAVDFSLPIAESHQKLFVRNPAESPNWTAFLEPLSSACWAVMGVMALTLPFVVTAAVWKGDKRWGTEFSAFQAYSNAWAIHNKRIPLFCILFSKAF